jgi:hypothetical protein
MKAASIKAVLVALATLVGSACLAQPAAVPPSDAKMPADICERLAAFLKERGGRVEGANAPITLDEVQRFARQDDRFACRSAISGMYTTGVILPAPLLDAIGVPTDTAGASRR